MKKLLKTLIYIYRVTLAPILQRFTSCRYEPSCSHYTEQAINKYGALQGSVMGLKRILSCHPFSKRPIYDPID